MNATTKFENQCALLIIYILFCSAVVEAAPWLALVLALAPLRFILLQGKPKDTTNGVEVDESAEQDVAAEAGKLN